MTQELTVTVVAVDDDEGHTELVRRNLKRAGIRNPLIALRSGAEALDFVLARGAYAARPACGEILILLDINMPGGLDGIEVLRTLKSDERTRHIPVLMLTTTDDPRDIERCYELGCNVYITKPVEPAAFVEAIRKLGMFVSIVSLPKAGSVRP